MDEAVRLRFKARELAYSVYNDPKPHGGHCDRIEAVADAIVDLYEEAQRARTS